MVVSNSSWLSPGMFETSNLNDIPKLFDCVNIASLKSITVTYFKVDTNVCSNRLGGGRGDGKRIAKH